LSTYLEKSVETFMRQQEVVQSQLARMMTNAPMSAMSELTRHNLELWGKMQESMLAAFNPIAPSAPPSPKPNRTDTDADTEQSND
jgi:polyhydroxyalkanoate synthesis regulator protein